MATAKRPRMRARTTGRSVRRSVSDRVVAADGRRDVTVIQVWDGHHPAWRVPDGREPHRPGPVNWEPPTLTLPPPGRGRELDRGGLARIHRTDEADWDAGRDEPKAATSTRGSASVDA